jgi:hypothetical protein
MTDLIVVPQQTQWHKLKSLVLDSVSSPITKRVYNRGLDEFFVWFSQEPRPGFTKATVSAWRVALEARGLGAVSINERITAVRKLAVEAADNGLLAPELASGITRVKGVASKGVRLGNRLTVKQAQTLLNTPDASKTKCLHDRAILAVLLGCGLRRSESAALTFGHVQLRLDESYFYLAGGPAAPKPYGGAVQAGGLPVPAPAAETGVDHPRQGSGQGYGPGREERPVGVEREDSVRADFAACRERQIGVP